MKLEQQVVSLELAKKLKELGVKQESEFYWVKQTRIAWGIKNTGYSGMRRFSAFTVAELVNMLTLKGVNDKISLSDISADYLAKKLISHYEKSKV